MQVDAAFWHIAALNHWREIFTEQLRLIVSSGFTGELVIGFIGHKDHIGFMRRGLGCTSLNWSIHHHGDDVKAYEYPTLKLIWDYCRGASGEIAYFHTKGASKPNDWVATMWRWAMNMAILSSLGEADVIGEGCTACGPFLRPRYPDPLWHFQGNFWRATSGHIKDLEDPLLFQEIESQTWRPGWRCPRFAAEYWIGSAYPVSKAYLISPVKNIVWPMNHSQWSQSIEDQRIVTQAHL
jgi:hypothetical protein